MSVVRESPSALERTLLNLEERIDRVSGLTENDVRPSAQQDHDVIRGLNRVQALLGVEVHSSKDAWAEELLAKANSQWEAAVAATHPAEWARAADSTLHTLTELSDAIGLATGRPSVLKATTEDVEAILGRALKREKSKPGKHEFYDLPRLTLAGLPSGAFGLASGAVGAALVEQGFGEDDEPPPELRLPLLERALEVVRLGRLDFPPDGSKVRAEPYGKREAVANAAAGFPDEGMATMEGVPAEVSGPLSSRVIDTRWGRWIRYSVAGETVEPDSIVATDE